jgi:hypothetical protein
LIQQSAALREKLLAELGNITSADSVPNWASGALTAKNSLTATDAKLVEDAFERKLLELPPSETDAPSDDDSSVIPPARSQETVSAKTAAPDQAKGIDKSILTVAAPHRYRNREHLRYVAQQACLVCARKPSDPHHLGFTQPRALGRKVSDEFAVPLCRGHHRAVHRSRDERAWWRQTGIDPIKVACRLWKQTRGMGRRLSQRPALPRPHAATASSDPKNEEMSATTTPQEETRSPDLPGSRSDGRGSYEVENEPAGEDISNLGSIDQPSKRRCSRRRAWRDGLADQTVVQNLEHVRSYRAFEHSLISSVDPRTVIDFALVHRLASLL